MIGARKAKVKIQSFRAWGVYKAWQTSTNAEAGAF